MGPAIIRAPIQAKTINSLLAFLDVCGLKGVMMALYLSRAMSMSVKMLTFTHKVCTRGHNLHIKGGKSHLCTRAAWNWKGMHKAAMMMSLIAKLAMSKLLTFCKDFVVETTHKTRMLPYMDTIVVNP